MSFLLGKHTTSFFYGDFNENNLMFVISFTRKTYYSITLKKIYLLHRPPLFLRGKILMSFFIVMLENILALSPAVSLIL
jgi:hypothetical protein